MEAASSGPFSMLMHLAGDPTQIDIFSADSCIEGWLATERALAIAQGELGIIAVEDSRAIAAAATIDIVDRDELWKSSKNVGYPILGLVRQISAQLPAGPDGRVHYGATTQDIMDSALALQLSRSMIALDAQLEQFGDALAVLAQEHATTVMPGRTHAQQAVPTTFGATLSTLLGQLTRHRTRLAEARPRVAMISMFGAGGTSAAYGPQSVAVRHRVAELLELHDTETPWHVERDGLAEFGWLCATIAGACAKLARNVVDLSRTEIGEVFEPYSSHRGASSTMPQKVNPISSEAIIGLSGTAAALASTLPRIQEAGHERSAGEWQIEWHVIPQLAVLAGSALSEAIVIAEGMRVDADRMRENLDLDGGLVMAEAHMIHLADAMGREHAHDLVYEAAARARSTRRVLADTLPEVAREAGKESLLPEKLTTADDYLGEAVGIVSNAVRTWQQLPVTRPTLTRIDDLAQVTS